MTSTEAKWITTVWRTVFDLITLFMHRSQHTQLDYYAKFKSTHGAGAGDGDGGAAVVIASCFSSFFVILQSNWTNRSFKQHSYIHYDFILQPKNSNTRINENFVVVVVVVIECLFQILNL